MDLSEEQVNQYGEDPEKCIVDIIIHVTYLFRHDECGKRGKRNEPRSKYDLYAQEEMLE